MRHPFELEIAELEIINFELEELSTEVAEKVTGGRRRSCTTMAIGEEGGGGPTTMATGEEGGGLLALGQESKDL